MHRFRLRKGLRPADVAPQVDLVDGLVSLVLRVVRPERSFEEHPESKRKKVKRAE